MLGANWALLGLRSYWHAPAERAHVRQRANVLQGTAHLLLFVIYVFFLFEP